MFLKMFLTLVVCFLFFNFKIINSARVTTDPEDVLISVGEDASFSCEVKLERNDEELTYEVGWYSSGNIVIASGNTILISNQRYTVEKSTKLEFDGLYVTTTLKIAEVKHSDGPTFTCYIIDQPSIRGSASLMVRLAPVPQCMDLPKTVTITDRLTLSCMIGAGNYDIRLTWYYEGDETQGYMYIDSQMTSPTMKSYLNSSINIHSYANGTIFKCTATNLYGEESCSTNPLNIVEKAEETSLDVKVESINTLPLIAGSQACFKCRATCKTGTCVGLLSYSWRYFRTASFLPITTPEIVCLVSVSLNDNGKILTCVARHSESGTADLTLEVVDYIPTTITQHILTTIEFQEDVGLQEETTKPHCEVTDVNFKNYYHHFIASVVTTPIIIIGFGLIFYFKYKHKNNNKMNNIDMNTLSAQSTSLHQEGGLDYEQVPDNPHQESKIGRQKDSQWTN